MTGDKISGHYNDASFTIFGPSVMLELATEEHIAEKVFKYLIPLDYNCRKSKTYLEF